MSIVRWTPRTLEGPIADRAGTRRLDVASFAAR
jgi:hypothetical protein